MGKNKNEVFEVEVILGANKVPTLLSVEASFELYEDGPEELHLDLIYQLDSDSDETLVFSKHEIDQIRFAVADAIERKYWTGEYNSYSDLETYQREAPKRTIS